MDLPVTLEQAVMVVAAAAASVYKSLDWAGVSLKTIMHLLSILLLNESVCT